MIAQICEESKCTGCLACMNLCPCGAITCQEREDGNVIPQIDPEKCIECHRCVQGCPENHVKEKHEPRQCYAAWQKDRKERKYSASGGIAFGFYKRWIQNAGIVYGAAFNEKMEVEHRIISNLNELPLLMGSKYVQSNILPVLKEVKSILTSTSHKVLFSGTPCQIAGLLNYLHKRYDNLITIDIVCHGVPSPGLWHKYIRYQKTNQSSDLISYKFRYKKKSWTFFHSQLLFKNGQKIEYNWFKDPWIRIFLQNKCLRESCYTCHYTSIHRISDITLADFWGYKSNNKDDKNTDKGISLVLLNSSNGISLFNSSKHKLKYFPRSLEAISKSQRSLSKPWSKPIDYENFWQDYHLLSFEGFLHKNFKASPSDIGSFCAKYGFVKTGLFLRWKINKIKDIIKKHILHK